jgi:hypothetical protein
MMSLHLIPERAPRGAVRRPTALLAAVFCWVVAAVGVAGAGSFPVHDYELGAGVHAQIFPDGTIDISVAVADGPAQLLRLSVPWPEDRRAVHGEANLFTAVTGEGAENGHRGFARDADDDGDGSTDEDRHDGRDNDGDGEVDEDFAAVSDQMTVVDATRDGRTLHLETYHWAYPHLQRTLLVSIDLKAASGQPIDADVLIAAAAGGWQRSDLNCRARPAERRTDAASLSALVSGQPDPRDRARTIWMGIAPLDPAGARGGRDGRVRREKRSLAVPFIDGRAQLAIAIAPTYLQLTGSLAAATAVYAGAVDPVTGQSVRWIVPPLMPTDPSRPAQAAYWSDEEGATYLAFELQPASDQLFDPDLFTWGDRPLGSPTAIAWYPHAGDVVEIPWQPLSPALLKTRTTQLCDPYGAIVADAAGEDGRLVFRFAPPSSTESAPQTIRPAAKTVTARSLDGRRVTLPLVPGEPTPAAADQPSDDTDSSVDHGRPDEPASNRPSLNPRLLETYPNPFRDVTQVRFSVPRTVGEGFVWRPDQQPSLAPESAIPYSSGYPMVTVSIYGLNGQEIAALFAEQVSPGEYHASWNGADLHGRPVAAGTYFCKLQVDKWSVTKRLVFLR